MLSFNNIIIYLRKSRSDDPTQSVEEVLARHEHILQEYCMKEYGECIPENRIYREVVSGETIQDRPIIQQVLRLLESGSIDGVLVVEPQRLSRGDLENCGHIVNSFRYTNTQVITPTKTYNLQDEYDRKFFEMERTRGNDYLEYTKKILARGRLASVMQGNYINAIRPYGYNKIVIGTGKDKIHTLEIFKEESDVLLLMKHLYLDENYGLVRIAHTLDDLSIKAPKGDHWSASTISRILSNPLYNGKIVWNKRKTVVKWKDGKKVKSKPLNRGDDVIIVQGKHPAIFDDETFNAILKRMENSPKVKRSSKLRNPFAGLLFCSTCGSAMILRRSGRKSGVYSLTCNRQSICHTKSVQYKAVLLKVKQSLAEAISDFEVKMSNNNTTASELHAINISTLENELEQLYRKDLIQKDAFEDGTYSKAEYMQRNAQLQTQIAAVTDKLNRARKDAPEPVSYEERIVCFRDCLNALDDDTVSAEVKNTLLKACISKIVYYNDSPSISGIGRYVDNPFRLEIFLKL